MRKRKSSEPPDSHPALDIDKWDLARMRRKTPRVPESFDDVLGRILDEKVKVKTRVGRLLFTNREYFIETLHERAKAGDPTAREFLLSTMRVQTPERVKAKNEVLRHHEKMARRPPFDAEKMARKFGPNRRSEQRHELE